MVANEIIKIPNRSWPGCSARMRLFHLNEKYYNIYKFVSTLYGTKIIFCHHESIFQQLLCSLSHENICCLIGVVGPTSPWGVGVTLVTDYRTDCHLPEYLQSRALKPSIHSVISGNVSTNKNISYVFILFFYDFDNWSSSLRLIVYCWFYK